MRWVLDYTGTVVIAVHPTQTDGVIQLTLHNAEGQMHALLDSYDLDELRASITAALEGEPHAHPNR